MACFSNITKNEHLHVRVSLHLGMRNDVSDLRHMVLVASEPYFYHIFDS